MSAILIITILVFLPSLNNEFVNWDDDRNFYENELITNLNDQNFWENTRTIFTTDVIGNYNPLTIFTFALEQRAFGLEKPFYWHLNNLILHLICTLLVFLIGYRLRLGLFGAALLAMLFGIHPMRVESVAWITERKDVLFGAFYLLAMLYYIKGKQEGFRKRDILIIAVSFLLSLLSKVQAVLLPVSLVFVDYYLSKNATISWKSIWRKTPLFLASLVFGLINISFLKSQGSIDQQAYYGIDRLFIGSYSLTVYYIKSLIPYELSPLYPYPGKLDYRFYLSIVTFIVTAAALWLAYKKKWRVWFFGLGFFIANVILLLQILGAGQGFLADRFTYIPYFGLFFIMAFYFNKLLSKNPGIKWPFAAVAVVLAIYGYMSFQQCKIWKNGGTLWTHVLKYYDKTTLPFGNRANFYRDAGFTDQALSDYSNVIRLKPDKPEAYNSRARLYFNFDHPDSLNKALFNYNKAIELKPDDVEYRVNRGATYAKLNNFGKALEDLNAAQQIDPAFPNIYLNRSIIYNTLGEFRKAYEDIVKYTELRPYHADMWYERGRLAHYLKLMDDALNSLNKAISFAQRGMYYFERAKVHYVLNNRAAAKQDIINAQQLGYQGDPQTVNKILNG